MACAFSMSAKMSRRNAHGVITASPKDCCLRASKSARSVRASSATSRTNRAPSACSSATIARTSSGLNPATLRTFTMSASTRTSSDGTSLRGHVVYRLRLSQRDGNSLVCAHRRLSLPYRVGGRRLHRFEPLPGVWHAALQAGGAPGFAHLAVLHAGRTGSVAAAPWSSRARIQCPHHTSHDLGVCDFRLCGRFLRHPFDAGELVRVSPLHRRTGATQERTVRLVLSRTIAWILRSVRKGDEL